MIPQPRSAWPTGHFADFTETAHGEAQVLFQSTLIPTCFLGIQTLGGGGGVKWVTSNSKGYRNP